MTEAINTSAFRFLMIAWIMFGLSVCCRCAKANQHPCASSETRLVVLTERHRLFLCEEGKKLRDYPVHLGRSGVGKTQEGDGKVPLGVYPLGVPRPSKKFGTFIPVGYPTPEQRNKGYTGGAIGIHGPLRMFKWLGSLLNLVDSTQGCIGLSSDEEVDEIADFVRSKKVKRIEIR